MIQYNIYLKPTSSNFRTLFFFLIAIHLVMAKEYFSSVAGMEELLKTEAHLIQDIEEYIASMSSQIKILKR